MAQVALGLQPVVLLVPGLAAPLLEKLVSLERDLVVRWTAPLLLCARATALRPSHGLVLHHARSARPCPQDHFEIGPHDRPVCQVLLGCARSTSERANGTPSRNPCTGLSSGWPAPNWLNWRPACDPAHTRDPGRRLRLD